VIDVLRLPREASFGFTTGCQTAHFTALAAARDHLLRHPRPGTPMRLIDLAYFVAEHDDHDLARLRELTTTDATHSREL
jgi:hypothetical protein